MNTHLESTSSADFTVCDGCGAKFAPNGDHYCDSCNDFCDLESQRWADAQESYPAGGRYF